MATKRKSPEEVAKSREKSNANLKKGKETQFKSGDEAPKREGSKGGKKSQQVQREERSVRQMLEMVMSSKPVLTPALRTGLTGMGMDPDKGEYSAAFLSQVALAQKCMRGDTKAYQKYLEVIGQDPKVLLEQERLKLEKESLQQGISGYSALDDAFARLSVDGDDQ